MVWSSPAQGISIGMDTIYILFYYFIKGKIGPKFSHFLTIRAGGAEKNQFLVFWSFGIHWILWKPLQCADIDFHWLIVPLLVLPTYLTNTPFQRPDSREQQRRGRRLWTRVVAAAEADPKDGR